MGTLMLRRAAGTCCLLSLLLAPAGRGQIRIALTVADGEGHAALVQFGYDPGATRCIDTALGEFELPPGGCGDPYVCASFRDVRSDGSACLGEGVLIDLRPFGAASDTFRLAVTGPDRAVTLRWQIGPGARFDSLRMLDLFGGAALNVDMLDEDSALVDLSQGSEFYVAGWGALEVSGASPPPELPVRTLLAGCYPNPFNPSTTVSYRVAERAPVRLSVYDLLGREVARLVDAVVEPGDHTAVWDASGFPSGWYACRMTAPGAGPALPLLLVR